MADVQSFTRIYPFAAGLEHVAAPGAVDLVIASMNASAGSDAPFKVLFRLDDGSSVMVSPKRGRP